MIVKRVNLCALDTGSLTLGYVGENDHTQIRINCASVFADYPAAVVSMTVKAPSGVVYPRDVETDGQIVIWTITDSDTASAGNGQIQLTFTEDGTIVKTVIAVTTVRASLVGDNPPPDPITDWIDEAGEALAKLEGLTASATELPAGEDPTAEVEVVDGHYNIALGIPGGDADSIIDDTAGVGDTTKVWSANKSATDLSELKSEIDGKAPAIYQDASGDIVSFADGADNMPLSSCVVSIDPVQAGSGDPSPENIRSISGHDSATICRTGKNRWDSAVFLTASGWTKSGDEYTGSSANLYSASWTGIGYRKFKPNTQYTFSFWYKGDEEKNTAIDLYYTDGTYTRQNASVTTYTKYTLVSTAWKTVNYIRFGYGSATTIHFKEVMLEEGSSASTYKPYQGQTYSISWQTAAGTVYGGTVDTKTGVLTVDKGSVNLGTLTWSTTGYSIYQATVTGMEPPPTVPDRRTGIICSMYGVSSTTAINDTMQDKSMLRNSNVIFIRDTSYQDVATFTTAMSGVQLVYKLATPLVYSLTDLPTITTLPGYNAIWSDTGAVALTYPADTRTYVDSAITAATDPDGNVVTVSGSTPSITGESGKRYICGTVDSISITPPQTGIVDVVFSSGTTPTVLTVPNTVRFPAWFDSTSLNASTVYEINIQDGYGAVSKWT